MADTDLVFGSPASGVTADLVFGGADSGAGDTSVRVAVNLPPVVAVRADVALPVSVSAVMPVMVVSVQPQYVSGAARPLVGKVNDAWQAGALHSTGIRHAHQAAMSAPAGAVALYSGAERAYRSLDTSMQSAAPIQRSANCRYLDGTHESASASAAHQEALRLRSAASGRSQQGLAQAALRSVRHQDGLRDRRNRTAARWQVAVRKSAWYSGSAKTALQVGVPVLSRHQQSKKPAPGKWSRPGPPVPDDSCYTPSGHLLFDQLWDGSAQLVFVCERRGDLPPATVTVPVRRVYVVLNEASLRRVDGNLALPTFQMSLSLDADSWTWAFSASLPGRALADLEPASAGEPVLVEATINGVPYRMQVEKRSRDRSFGQSAIKISGRGLSAALDAPYSPSMNFSNSGVRTAQQLMNDVLTLNGVSIGWAVDWQAVDWSIPAGTFSHQGTYIAALNTIAAAAGSYIQPHRTDQSLSVLPRYPRLPWEWDTAVPDYEIPSALATVEGIEWTDKAVYNRVFVSGVRNGVLGQVTRAGTDGGLVAPMVTDALITTAAAARQRAIPILADTGSQAAVTLRLPVLSETGVIAPGKFVRYADGDETRIGLTRSVSVGVGLPEIWQTIVLETRV